LDRALAVLMTLTKAYQHETLLSMDTNTYFLKISGYIGSGKQREFQQTIQFIFNHLPPGCLSHHLALDVFNPNLYHVISTWQSKGMLVAFKGSHEYELLKSSLETLGAYESAIAGRLTDIDLSEVTKKNF
jgi:hypothetical protein